MVLDTNEHPAVLKDAVTSSGGTTICGIHALERGGLRYNQQHYIFIPHHTVSRI